MQGEGFHSSADGKHEASIGTDAVCCHQVATIISGLKLSIATDGKMILTRGATPKRLMELAKTYTGKNYKRTEKQKCNDDLQIWFNNMKSALPSYTRGE